MVGTKKYDAQGTEKEECMIILPKSAKGGDESKIEVGQLKLLIYSIIII